MVAFYRVQVPKAETSIVVGCAMNVCFVDVASRSVSCIMRGPRLPCLFSFLQDLIQATFAMLGLTGQDQVFTPRQIGCPSSPPCRFAGQHASCLGSHGPPERMDLPPMPYVDRQCWGGSTPSCEGPQTQVH
jgi:hypothetical protein